MGRVQKCIHRDEGQEGRVSKLRRALQGAKEGNEVT
jgi:hypothetical protein